MRTRLRDAMLDLRGRTRTALTFDAGAPDAALLLAGCGRSGTTWLGNVIAHDRRARQIFEPFDPRRIDEFAALPRREFVPHGDSRDDLIAAFSMILEGRLRTVWTDGQSPAGRYNQRLVKDIRICGQLGWLADNFATLPIVVTIRNPWANASSRLRLGWRSELWTHDPALALAHYPELEALMADPTSELAGHMRTWIVDNLMALTQLPTDRARIVFYEHVADPTGQSLLVLRQDLTPGAGALPDHLQPRRPAADHRQNAIAVAGQAAVDEADELLRSTAAGLLYDGDEPQVDALEALVGRNRRA